MGLNLLVQVNRDLSNVMRVPFALPGVVESLRSLEGFFFFSDGVLHALSA